MSDFKKLAKALTKLEGKKKQVDVAQMSEVLSKLQTLAKEDSLFIFKVVFKHLLKTPKYK